MFNKILIANRGEIAVRIIRACREMGIETVSVFSEGDRNAIHTELSDEAVCIGPSQAKYSYLNMQNIISAAVNTGAEAIHPGYGFLSENSKFADICSKCNIKFIGPTAETIENMGNKSRAKVMMQSAGIPVIEGSNGSVKDVNEALSIASNIGFPVMIKASAGGGGRGIRIARDNNELKRYFETAKVEAKVSFGDDTMYIEKFIQSPKHIEIQILSDRYGNSVYLGERDCSMQRRNQKILEEAPSAVVNHKLRKQMGEIAIKVANTAKYENAGTVEFLLDNDENFYFCEMNTRVQVEHPITEMITGIDIIKEQIRIANGMKLQFGQGDIRINGHAIECRINAEDPKENFRPSSGTIKKLHIPGGPGIRVDSFIYEGYTISSFYDSMIAKLITWGKDRDEAICRMKRALGEFIIEGTRNNIDFLIMLINNEKFEEGKYDTSFVLREFKF